MKKRENTGETKAQKIIAGIILGIIVEAIWLTFFLNL